MDPPGRVRLAGGGAVTAPVNPDHFEVRPDGSLTPQPWMQWRNVRGIEAPSKSASYGVTGSVMNKFDLIHSLRLSWTNNTPIPQWVYGLITRGGCRVTLQARTRAYLQVRSGYRIDPIDAGELTVCSRMGVGSDIGRGGVLGVGTGFCVAEQRMNSVTFPLAPERAGWERLDPGDTFTAKVEVHFASQQWEVTMIDGGTSGTESSFDSGGTRLDLFAVPVL